MRHRWEEFPLGRSAGAKPHDVPSSALVTTAPVPHARIPVESRPVILATSLLQAASLLTDNPVTIAVIHIAIRWMTTPDRRNAVPPRLRARDSPIAIVIVLLQRALAPGSWGLGRLCTRLACTSAADLTHDAIAIAVSHVGIGWMVATHGRNAVRAGFRTGDPAVAVVVPSRNLLRQASRTSVGNDALLHRSNTPNKGCRRAGRKHPVQRVNLPAINGQAILLADAHHSSRKPALVPVRQPSGGIMGVFLSTIHSRTRKG